MSEDIGHITAALNDLYRGQNGTQRLFDAIDELKTLQLGETEIPIPQLVVVGEQSSGKSSVLQSIAQFRLPIGMGICTRFPIEVVLRRSNQRQLSMRIIPSSTSKGDQQAVATMKAFHVVKNDFEAGVDIIADVKEAAGIIGVPIDEEAQGRRGLQYSDDILRITYQGPEHHDLTLIDLPGLFNRATGEQSKEDKIKVRKIVKRYTEDPKSIILLVCKGSNDYSVNTAPNIIDTAAENRTLGILTHLDIRSNVEQALKLYRGELEVKFKLGWHFLVNKHEDDSGQRLSLKERDDWETQTFNEKFAGLPENAWGIVRLRKRLGKLLLKLILHNLPKMIDRIKKAVENREAELKRLPAARTTEYEQRIYLAERARDFENLAMAATWSKYSEYEDFFGDYDRAGLRGIDGPNIERVRRRKLQSTIRGLNRVFSAVMQQHGRSRILDNLPSTYQEPKSSERNFIGQVFDAPEDENSNPAISEKDVPDDANNENDDNEYNTDDEIPQCSFESGYTDQEVLSSGKEFVSEDMTSRYFQIPKPDPISIESYEDELQSRKQEWLGKEPRSEVNSDYYAAVFRKLTSKWADLAKTHLETVYQSTVEFTHEALEHIMPEDLRDNVRSRPIDPGLRELWQKANDRLKELVECHTNAIDVFMDTGPDFFLEDPFQKYPASADKLPEWAQTLIQNLRSINDFRINKLFELPLTGDSPGLTAECKNILGDTIAAKILDQLLKVPVAQNILNVVSLAWRIPRNDPGSRDVSPEQEAVRRIIYHGERFYMMTVPSFVGYINALIVEGIFMKGLRDNIFTIQVVKEMDPITLQLVAGESEDLSERRSVLSVQVHKLKEILHILQEFMSRRA
ncbi:P-loop containing nucleoside triphosphate hydrolase protein [Aspergillus tetrazonus]